MRKAGEEERTMAARNYATLTGPDIGVLAGYFVLVILIGLFVSSALTVFVFGHLIFFFYCSVSVTAQMCVGNNAV